MAGQIGQIDFGELTGLLAGGFGPGKGEQLLGQMDSTSAPSQGHLAQAAAQGFAIGLAQGQLGLGAQPRQRSLELVGGRFPAMKRRWASRLSSSRFITAFIDSIMGRISSGRPLMLMGERSAGRRLLSSRCSRCRGVMPWVSGRDRPAAPPGAR